MAIGQGNMGGKHGGGWQMSGHNPGAEKNDEDGGTKKRVGE